jgi:hypothetical protein
MGSFINEFELQKVIEKTRIYQGQEDLIFDDLHRVLNNLSYEYNTKNSNSLARINNSINQKFSTIMSIHKSNINVIERTIEKYHLTEKKVENMFSELGK